MPLEMYGFDLSQMLSSTQRCFCVHSVLSLCHFPMWLFQVPHSSQTLYPTSSVTLGNTSCQQILEKTEARREFFHFLPANLELDLYPHPPFYVPPVPVEDVSSLVRALYRIPSVLKNCFTDGLLSSVSSIFHVD